LTGIKRNGAPCIAHGGSRRAAALDQAGGLNSAESRRVGGVTNEHGAEIRAVTNGNCVRG
jgi:hypothetical protein